jgi:hypothetical protein
MFRRNARAPAKQHDVTGPHFGDRHRLAAMGARGLHQPVAA